MSSAVAGPLQEYVEAYEKSRRKVVEEAKHKTADLTLRWFLEDFVELTNSFFRLAERRLAEWRKAVASGTLAYDDCDDQSFRFTFSLLLGQADEGVLSKLETLCRQHGPIAGLNELLVHHEKVRRIMRQWTTPVLSKARGLHEDSLTEEEADELDRIIQSGEAAVRVPPGHR
jgi:hypothetical protein